MVEVQLRKQVFEQRCCLETFRPHPEIGPLLLQNSVKETHWSVASKDWSCTKCWSNLGPSFPDTASCWRTLVQKMADESIPSWKYDKQLESSSTVYPFIPTSLSGRMSWQWTVDIFFWLEYHQNLTKCFFGPVCVLDLPFIWTKESKDHQVSNPQGCQGSGLMPRLGPEPLPQRRSDLGSVWKGPW